MSIRIGTGQTVYDIIMSVDSNNIPVTGVTFSSVVHKDGSVYTGVTASTVIADNVTGAYTGSWSADTTGVYQILYTNNVTNVLFITDSYQVLSDDELSTNVYIGL